jgi:hypothetical protein
MGLPLLVLVPAIMTPHLVASLILSSACTSRRVQLSCGSLYSESTGVPSTMADDGRHTDMTMGRERSTDEIGGHHSLLHKTATAANYSSITFYKVRSSYSFFQAITNKRDVYIHKIQQAKTMTSPQNNINGSPSNKDENETNNGIWIGIDLGTSNCACAVWDSTRGGAKPLRLETIASPPFDKDKVGRMV